ncbi:TRAP transporter large permease [Chachezhania sediminis]|uniref:TRAP transporter large permease n=1 Tax=Chachezhania sediminis TaxID=2599291 RepID=UPI00131E1E85|nr:TRAP transporter large permease subunit [Chachezhania sediminis]
MPPYVVIPLIIAGLLLLRQNIAVILMVVLAYLQVGLGGGQLTWIAEDVWNAIDSEILLPIPLFILCGGIMTRGSIAAKLIRIIRVLTCPLPGGLAVAAIVSCAVFAAISGSSPVTMLAVGTVLYPALLNEGYDQKFALGALVSSGTLGIIIPPSIPMILYGISTETSITDIFTAGILPGLLLTATLSGYALFVNRKMTGTPWVLADIVDAFRDGILALLMPVILLAGIFSGFFTATESAAVALAYAVLIEVLVFRELSARDFLNTAIRTTALLGTLFPVLALALGLNKFLIAEGFPQMVAEWLNAHVETSTGFLIRFNLLMLVVGCFMDAGSAILILAPIMNVIASSYGLDPVHMGIVMVMNLEIGFLTPPMGLNLIVAMTAFGASFGNVVRSSLPFLALIVLVLLVVTWVPWLSLALL